MSSARSPHILALDVTGIDDVPLSVRIRPGAGEIPVLLVHGFGSSSSANWSATGWLGGLERAGRTSITVDVRGHGLSGKPHLPGSYRLPILLADLRNVLDSAQDVLGPVPFVDLVGYSMGGRLVGEIIATATDSGLGADTAPWSPELPGIRRAVIGGYDGRPLFDGLDFAQFEAALTGRAGPDSPSRRVADIALADAGTDLVALSALVQGLGESQSPLPSAAIGVPTLVVAGERDRITDATKVWAAGLPNGRHLQVPGRNHVSVVTSAIFRSAAMDWLKGE